jgi:photosystem II stability/assembly factor-like uncharacterized protein
MKGSYILCKTIALIAFFFNFSGELSAQGIIIPESEAVFEAGPILVTTRMSHNTAVLPDGSVVLFGGHGYNFAALNTAEICSMKESEGFTGLTMKYPHDGPAFVKLNDGKYLLAGGSSDYGVPQYATSEVFDPSDNSFTEVGSMVRFRTSAGGAALQNGKVLLASAWWTHNDAHTYGEIYDPSTQTFSATDAFSASRALAIVMPANDGSAVLLGGTTAHGTPVDHPIEIYDPESGNISILRNSLFEDETGWNANNEWTRPTFMQQMADGRYLWLANRTENSITSYRLFTFDPKTREVKAFNTRTEIPNSTQYLQAFQPAVDRAGNRAHLMALLPGGGNTPRFKILSVELGSGALTISSNIYQMDYSPYGAGFTPLPDGRIFLTGGSADGSNFNPTNKTLLITPPEKVFLPEPPIADFSASITEGNAPLTVQFTDLSSENTEGWSWYFGDEDYGKEWTLINSNAPWTERASHAATSLPDGSIILTGGWIGETYKNDVWLSNDKGETWSEMTSSAEWQIRSHHTCNALPDGSIVIMGGHTPNTYSFSNDVWRSVDKGVSWGSMTLDAPWDSRGHHATVVFPDGTIMIFGGSANTRLTNDIWKSEDKGETWTLVDDQADWAPRSHHTVVRSTNGDLLLMGGWTGNTEVNDLWKSQDNGYTWEKISDDLGYEKRLFSNTHLLADGSFLMFGGRPNKNDIWRSTDEGLSWSSVKAEAEWAGREDFASVLLPDGTIVLMGGNSNAANLNDVWLIETSASNEQNPTHTYYQPGTYTVTLKAYNKFGAHCQTRSGLIIVNDPTFINEEFISTEILVMPNPFISHINLKNSENVKHIVIKNLTGQTVYNLNYDKSQLLQLDYLSKGVYLIIFELVNGEHVARKVIKQ